VDCDVFPSMTILFVELQAMANMRTDTIKIIDTILAVIRQRMIFLILFLP